MELKSLNNGDLRMQFLGITLRLSEREGYVFLKTSKYIILGLELEPNQTTFQVWVGSNIPLLSTNEILSLSNSPHPLMHGVVKDKNNHEVDLFRLI